MKSFFRLTKENILNLYIPVLLFLVAFMWKFFYIGVRDVCIDEPFTIFNAQLSLKEILLLPTKNEPNPPLFMLILHFWVKLFGISPYSVRIIPLLFNALTPVFIYLTGKKISNYQGGILAAGLFILSSYQFYFGMETRTYSLLLCATSAAIYYLFSNLQNPERRDFLAGLIISNIALVYSHYFGLFVVFTEFLTALYYFRNRLALKKILIALVATGVSFLPMSVIIVKQFFLSKKQTWVKPPEASFYWREIVMFMNSKMVIWITLAVIGVGILLWLAGKQKKHYPDKIVTLFFFWFIPYTLMFFVSAKVPMFENRYVMYNSIGLYLFAGTAVAFLFQEQKYLSVLASALVLFFMGFNLQTRREFIAYRETKKAVDFVKGKTGKDFLTIVYPHWNDLEFAYYYDQEIFKDVRNFEPRLRDSLVYQVWSLDDAKTYIEKFKGKKIAYFRGGKDYEDINRYLDSAYVRTDSASFSDCYYIYIYNLKPELPDSLNSAR